jgi:NADH-quinone oxidoreductase subunit J
MIMESVLFAILAATAIVSGLGIITLRQPVHCALSFLVTLASLAGLYLLLWAPFIAVLQIIIYAGAIMVLFVFVMMLLHAQRGEGPTQYLRWQLPVTVVLAGLFLAVIAYFAVAASAALATVGDAPSPICPSTDLRSIEEMARCLFGPFLFPFEVASVVLLAALIGAVVLIKKSD